MLQSMAFLDDDDYDDIDLFVDEAYLLALIDEEPIPISDEKYALQLSFQEAIYSSSSQNPKRPSSRNPKNSLQLRSKYISSTSTNPKKFLQGSIYISSSTSRNPKKSLQSGSKYISSSTSTNSKKPLQGSIYASSSTSRNPKKSLHGTVYISPSTSRNPQKRIKTVKEMGESSKKHLIFCGICMEHKPNSEIFMGLSKCAHTFCTDCVLKYIASKIKENIGSVKCPEPKCKQVIEPENCSSILPKEVFERWENALFEAMIPGYQKFYCPYKDCSALMVDDGGSEVRSSECPSCKRLFCARCQVRWHEGLTCEEFDKLGKNERDKDDVLVFKMAKDNKWRRCPNCKIHVEKTEGCHHMSCRCRYEFCYKCGKKWSSVHQSLCLS